MQFNFKLQNFCKKVDLLEDSIKQYLYKYFPNLDKTYTSLVQDLKLQKSELERVMQELKQYEESK